MKKKLFSLALALALCLGLAVPAFAANANTSAELYTWISAENYPFIGGEFEWQQRDLNENRKSYGEVEGYHSQVSVVPTSEYFYVGVEGLAKDEENGLFMTAYTDHNGDGVYDQRLFTLNPQKNEIGVLPVQENGAYNTTLPNKTVLNAVELPGFDKQGDGDYAFSAARLHEFFGDRTLINFYIEENEGASYMGTVLLSAGPFDDVAAVSNGDYYGESVAWASDKSITVGSGDGNFMPGDDCTQIQILTFLSRAAGNTSAADYDWKTEQEAVKKWAKEKGMIDDSFDGSNPCTRATAAYYMWCAFNKPTAPSSSFADMQGYGEDYIKAVNWAKEKNVTRGTSETTFDPGTICNRAQIATFLYRAYNN